MFSLPAHDRRNGDPRRGLVQASCRHVCKCCGACQPLLVIVAFFPFGKIHQIQLLALNGKYWQVVFKETGKGELLLMTYHRFRMRSVRKQERGLQERNGS